jgi:hypothetical protein
MTDFLDINMAKKYSNSTSWREKRQRHGPNHDPKKTAKANRERFRRTKRGTFKRANDIFLDGVDNGSSRRVYVLVMNKSQVGIRYATYDSHPEENWVPPAGDVVTYPTPFHYDKKAFG